MQRIHRLQKRKEQLLIERSLLDETAPMHSEEGRQYVIVLTKLVLIELEIEAIQKEKAAQ